MASRARKVLGAFEKRALDPSLTVVVVVLYLLFTQNLFCV